MTTSQILEAITDRGLFENLATSVLRKQKDEYAHLVQTGMNAGGETVKSPVDGFCSIPGSIPPQYLLLAHTTTDTKGIKKKWLDDLDKADKEARKIRQKVAHAAFTVILTTNQRVTLDVLKEVDDVAQSNALAIDIWDQSRFADYLDTNSDGQWLRQMFLGINAVRLSFSLLTSICQQSQALHQRTISFGDGLNYVPRYFEDQIWVSVKDDSCSLLLLIGEAGFGKTTSVQRLLRERLAAGGLALWLPDEIVATSISLEDALCRTLQALHPGLEQEAGRAALTLVPSGSKLLLVVDDLNRGNAPEQSVRKLAAWARPASTLEDSKGRSQSRSNPFIFICPMWPRYWTPLRIEFNKSIWLRTIPVGRMSEDEGILAVKRVLQSVDAHPHDAIVTELAKRLGYDPFLIGLFGESLVNNPEGDWQNLSQNVTEQFISSQMEEASSFEGSTLLVSDYRQALSELATQMLRRHDIRPTWQQVLQWLIPRQTTSLALRELVRLRKLCSLDEAERLVFRHDRIRESFLTNAMVNAIAVEATELTLLHEPFYAEIIGHALVQSPQSQEVLSNIVHVMPLALAEAIRLMAPNPTEYFGLLVQIFKSWAEANMVGNGVPDPIQFAIYETMIETDSPAVIDITSNLPTNFSSMLARLRNGCARSGAQYCSIHNFMPSIQDTRFESVLERASAQHREEMLMGVKPLMTSPEIEDDMRNGALCMAGFLRAKDLSEYVATVWGLIQDKTSYLASAIWAASRCFDTDPAQVLNPLMTFWNALPDDESEAGWSRKIHIAEELKFAFARGLDPEIVDYFEHHCQQYQP